MMMNDRPKSALAVCGHDSVSNFKPLTDINIRDPVVFTIDVYQYDLLALWMPSKRPLVDTSLIAILQMCNINQFLDFNCWFVYSNWRSQIMSVAMECPKQFLPVTQIEDRLKHIEAGGDTSNMWMTVFKLSLSINPKPVWVDNMIRRLAFLALHKMALWPSSPVVDAILLAGLDKMYKMVKKLILPTSKHRYSKLTEDIEIFETNTGASGHIGKDGTIHVKTGVRQFQLPAHIVAVGFKAVQLPGVMNRAIAGLLIPKAARTNIQSIMPYDKFRTSQAIIAVILPLDNNNQLINDPQHSAISYHDPTYIYAQGQFQQPNNGYASDRDIICGPGLHFFVEPAGSALYRSAITTQLHNPEIIYDYIDAFITSLTKKESIV